MKTLRVCLSSELPHIPDMDQNFIYFAYDTLEIFVGNQGTYQGNYAIVEALPEDKSVDILYISSTNGDVNIWYDYQVVKIAEIESSSQVNLLKKAKTSFFHYASHRYLDMSRRVIKIPFKNGIYELVVDLPNNAIIDNDTVLRYDVEKEQFVEEGDQELHTPYIGIHGSTTDTVEIIVQNERSIEANVKISDISNNVLRKKDDGLFVDGSVFLKKDQYNEWMDTWSSTQNTIMDAVLDIREQLAYIETIISEEAITAKIQALLEQQIPTINEAIENYDNIINNVIPGWLQESKEYTDQQFETTKNYLMDYFGEYFSDVWDNVQYIPPEPEPEPDSDEDLNPEEIVPDEDLDPQNTTDDEDPDGE